MQSVTGIQFDPAGTFGWASFIVIFFAGGTYRRIEVPRWAKSRRIIEQINAYITAFQEQERAEAAPAAAAPQAFSVADELSKLASLRQQGILTEQEFQEEKQRLLNH